MHSDNYAAQDRMHHIEKGMPQIDNYALIVSFGKDCGHKPGC
jgi:hypothetical protein